MKRWLMILALLVTGTVPAAANPVLRWAPADPIVALGNQVTMSIMLDDALPVRTVELYIGYDSNIISTVDGGPGQLFAPFQGSWFSGFTEVDPENPGQWYGFCVILDAYNWAEGPGELFSWTVQADALGYSELTSVSVVLLPPGGGQYDEVLLPPTEIIVLDASAAPLMPAGGPTLDLFPNPFNPRVAIDFSLGHSHQGLLEVYDLRGRRVTTLWQGTDHRSERVFWDGCDATGRALPSGVYTFALIAGDGSRVTTRGTLLR
jgi:hypothetical protein